MQTAIRLAVLDVALRDRDHPVWGGSGWKVFLDRTSDIRRTIPYVENNPVKAGLPRQRYPFGTGYDNWHLRGRSR